MKQYLPYNVLLVVALVSAGGILLYNTLIRESFATTLRYAYPAVEQQTEPPPQPAVNQIPDTETTTETEPETETGIDPETETPETEPVTEAATEEVLVVQFPLDINTATLEEILLIPDVGNTMAQRIVQYRDHIGGAYSDLEQLMNISGIGEGTYAKLWAYFVIGGEEYEDYEDSEEEETDPDTES